jgi:hypothetical protein
VDGHQEHRVAEVFRRGFGFGRGLFEFGSDGGEVARVPLVETPECCQELLDVRARAAGQCV